jgi:hypothetical protein
VNPFYPVVAERAAGVCEYCRAPEAVFNFAFAIDHIIPRALGGSNNSENMALACESCNLFKSVVVAAWDTHEEHIVALYNPRTDLWLDHFRYNAVTNRIIGLTATGRVTVARLRLNSEFQIRARYHWTRIGLYKPLYDFERTIALIE